MPDDAATVLDIVLACRRVAKFLSGIEETAFFDDEEKRWAVASQLMLIGEAVRRMSPEFLDANPDVPWRQIAGMRNRLIHHYDTIDWPLVWTTASEEVAVLLAKLQPKLPPEPENADD